MHHPLNNLFRFFLLVTLFLAGCAASQDQKGFHKSDDFILCQLQQGDTAASLARKYLGDETKAWIIEDANSKEDLQPDKYAVIPLKMKNKGGIYSDGVQQVPILCYHRFGNQCDSPLCVPEEIFDSQMKRLKNDGFQTITPAQLIAYLEYREPLPKKSVMITVDDGYSSFYSVAYPILKKYGFTATLFIYTKYVGVSSKALSWDQIKELKREGFTIGSHTIMHSDLSKQGETESETAYINRLRHEIADSKKILDEKLDQDTDIFAYPFGRANEAAMLETQRAGYKLAVTVKRGGNPFYHNPYALRRDQVLKRDMKTFVSYLKTFKYMSLR